MVKVLPRGDEIIRDIASTASATVSPGTPSMTTLTPAGTIKETLVVAGQAPEAISGRISSVLMASIAGMSGPPSLVEGSITHPLELEANGLSFEAPKSEGPTSAVPPSESSEMMK